MRRTGGPAAARAGTGARATARTLAVLVALGTAAAGCEGGGPGAGDPGTAGADAADVADPDGADVPAGDVPGDRGPGDLPGDAAADLPGDGSPGDVGAGDAGDVALPDGACDYLDLQQFLFRCGTEFVFIPEWSDTAGNRAACPRYWTWGGQSFDTLDAAAAAAGCAMDCPYTLSTAVMFLHCGHRDEYMVWKAPDAACPDRLQFQTGFYESVEAYDADNPC